MPLQIETELEEYNRDLESEYLNDTRGNVNLRRLTNIGTFRAYAYNYLKHHPRIHKDMTLLVRQLAAGSEGVPIEVYCFTNTTDWNAYEGIQGDIFDHLLAIVLEFGLRLYQQPSGTLSNGQGENIFAGRTNRGLRRRALLAFDVAGRSGRGCHRQCQAHTHPVGDHRQGTAGFAAPRVGRLGRRRLGRSR